MKKGRLILLVNLCTVVSIVALYAYGKITERQLPLIAVVSLIIVNVGGVLGLWAKRDGN